jgi:hypothetical protein
MSKANTSGYKLKSSDAPIIFGMDKRGDRDHDIAAWFGVNQGRIAEVKDGSKFGIVPPALATDLPPKGPPGIKGRRLRNSIADAISALNSGDPAKAEKLLKSGADKYDSHER